MELESQVKSAKKAEFATSIWILNLEKYIKRETEDAIHKKYLYIS